MNVSKRYWLEALVIRGREGEDDPYERDDKGAILEEDGEQVLKEGWEYDEEDKPVRIEDPANEDTPEKKLADTQEALRQERKLRRQAQKEARQAKKAAPPKADDDKTQEELQTERTKSSRLAKGLLDTKMDTAIERAARKAGFIDPTDALLDSVRAEIDYEQDEDDPSDIDIDFDSVTDAVAALAAKKKHLVAKPDDKEEEEEEGRQTPPGTPSGSKMRRRRKQTNDPDETVLRGHYPSLNG